MLPPEDWRRLSRQCDLLTEVACIYADEERWKDALHPILSLTFPEYFSSDDPPEIARLTTDLLWRFNRPWMISFRMRAARAVQPTGEKIDELAPLIGMVRLEGPERCPRIVQALKEKILELLLSVRKHQLERALKFAEAPLGKHRNSLVWEAIYGVILERQEKIVSEGWLEGLDYPDALAKLETLYPDTKDVQAYAQRPKNKERFDKLPHDQSGWTRVWKASGAEVMVTKGVRGPGES